MKIAVCDDNPIFTEYLIKELRHCSAILDLENQYECFYSSKSLLNSDLSSVHVLFLDIEMPNCNGLDAARLIRENNPDIILVFVTSWLQYAPAGYKVNAFRYLLKSNLVKELPQCLLEICQQICDSKQSILLKQKESTSEVLVKDILYFEGTPYRSVLLHTVSQPNKPIECSGKLADYEARLSDQGFLRIQKSFLVNMAHIDRIKNKTAYLRYGQQLRVSEKNYSSVCSQYLIWRGQKL